MATLNTVRLARAGLLLLLVLATAAWLPAGARAVETSTRVTASTVYTVAPQRGVVRVDVRGQVTVIGNVGSLGSFTIRLPEGRRYRAQVAGQPARVRVTVVTPDAFDDPVTIIPATPLSGGQSATFRMSFELGQDDALGQVDVRQMVAAFPIEAAGSAGVPGSSVSVVIPSGWELDVIGSELPRRGPHTGGGFTYRWTDIDDPAGFGSFVTADRADVPDAFLRSSVTTSRVRGEDVSITVLAWRDDLRWGQHVAARIAEALPTLSNLIGLPYIGQATMVVRETSARSIGGYAGVFEGNLRQDDIKIAFDVDDGVVVHEAAHAWFDSKLAVERWILEGFASYYADQVVRAAGWQGRQVELSDELQQHAIPLIRWGGLGEEDDFTELYAYGASLRLARSIAERAGGDGLAMVWAAMIDREYAYQPMGRSRDEEPEQWPFSPGDSRYFLDLLEERTDRDFSELFEELVFEPADVFGLTSRSLTRAQYHALPAQLPGWRVPEILRRDMDRWDFGSAGQRIADGVAMSQAWKRSAQLAQQLGLPLADDVRQRWESGDTRGALTTAQHTVEALQALA
ncbi:MAG TPA: hypothetical protein VFK61_00285, partial [Candidatus Limnocylindria bacterium]|nr:hypothetical protein [Candidatus Limnocylindria bacterium]